MPAPTWENLSEFFDPDEFATVAKISRAGEQIGEVLGIFEDPNELAELGEYELDHKVPTFTCSAADAAIVAKGDIAEIDGQSFDVMQEPQRDGTGIAKLILAEPNVMYNAGL